MIEWISVRRSQGKNLPIFKTLPDGPGAFDAIPGKPGSVVRSCVIVIVIVIDLINARIDYDYDNQYDYEYE